MAVRWRAVVPWLAAALALGLFSGLGVWQLQRAAEKAARMERIERGREAPARPLPATREALERRAFTRVAVDGRFLGERQFLLDNRTHEGRPGFDVLTPLATRDGRTVLVDRGWVPMGARREPARAVALEAQASGPVTGVLWLPDPAVALGPAIAPGEGWPRTVTRVEFPALEAALGRELVHAVIRVDDARAPWAFRPRGLEPPFGPMRHYGYAVQWFALALTVIVIAVVLVRRRGRQRQR